MHEHVTFLPPAVRDAAARGISSEFSADLLGQAGTAEEGDRWMRVGAKRKAPADTEVSAGNFRFALVFADVKHRPSVSECWA